MPSCYDLSGQIYLAGPMSGMPWHNKPSFYRAAIKLRRFGLNVLNPAELDEWSGPLPKYEDYIKRDIPYLLESQSALFLPKWHLSKGAFCEFVIARTANIPCFRTVDNPKEWGNAFPAIVPMDDYEAGFIRCGWYEY